jgi:N-acetylmuramoyl-L-alanine amidase
MSIKKEAVLRKLVPLLALLTMALTLTHVYGGKQSASTVGGTGATLVIDPGHGGIDSGAVGIDGTRESDLNLAIALKLRAMAELYGMENTLLRQDDSTLCDSEDYSEHRDLEHRTELTCAALNPVYISIHQNDYPTAQPNGSQVIYAAGEGSQRLGSIMHENLLNILYPKCRRVAEPATKRLYILSRLTCPAVLVECGFVSNMIDLENLKKPAYQTALAAIMMGSYLQYEQNTKRI